jgi:hypothetical protein
MAPTTRAKGDAETHLIELINNSPAKKKASEKKRKEAERRAVAAAEKSAKQKSSKAKLSAKKNASNKAATDYSAYDKETAFLLTRSDAQITYNAKKAEEYSDFLTSFDRKKHPEALRLTKAKIDKYTEYTNALRKGRTQLLNASKPAKGKKKDSVADPLALISSGEYDSLVSQRSAYPTPLPVPPFLFFGTAHNATPILFLFYTFLSLFSFAYPALSCPALRLFRPRPSIPVPDPSTFPLTLRRNRSAPFPSGTHHPYENGNFSWCLPPSLRKREPPWCLPPLPRKRE